MYYIIIIAQRVNSISSALMKYSLYFFYTAQKRQPLINRICRSFLRPQCRSEQTQECLMRKQESGNVITKRRICHSDDSLPSSSSCQQIFHIHSGSRFTVFLTTTADSSLIRIMTPYHPRQFCDCCLLPKKEGRSNLKCFPKTIDKEIFIR